MNVCTKMANQSKRRPKGKHQGDKAAQMLRLASAAHLLNYVVNLRGFQRNVWVLLEQSSQEALHLIWLDVVCVVKVINSKGNCMSTSARV